MIGEEYGYTFEHEETYEKFCLVNDAVYIAKGKKGWTAVGAEFSHPYIFKNLFSNEKILFKDMCEIKSVTTALYLDMNENLNEGEHNYVFIGKTGSFCPVIDGSGGGILLREKDGKYYSVSGTKGYRWMESEVIRKLEMEDKINQDYYRELIDNVIKHINQFTDFNLFID